MPPKHSSSRVSFPAEPQLNAMHILQVLYALLTSIKQCICGSLASGSRGDEESLPESSRYLFADRPRSQQSQRSLTSTYTDFSRSRQALVLFLSHAVAYYSLAIIGFSFLVEDHSIVDALYMATVIFTTIGYGDTAPDHSAARVYMIFLATYGVIILGIVLGILGDIIVEGQNVNTRARRRKLQQYFLGSMGRFNNANPDSFTEFSGTKASLSSEIVSTFLLEAPVVLIVFALGVMIGFHEGWTVLESIYWTVVSSYTIGFGDFAPESPVMRLFCVFFLPFSVAVFGEILSRIASVYMARKRSTTEQSFLHRTLTIHDLRILDKDGDGTVTRAEFLEYMLVALQKVDQEDIDELHNAFERLDSDQSGTLTAQDLVASLQSSRQLLTLNLVSL